MDEGEASEVGMRRGGGSASDGARQWAVPSIVSPHSLHRPKSQQSIKRVGGEDVMKEGEASKGGKGRGGGSTSNGA